MGPISTKSKKQNLEKRDQTGCVSNCDEPPQDDDEEDEPKRLVVYFNFEKVMKHGRIADKSGYENSGTMGQGGEILKFSDKEYTCNQAARLYDHDIYLRGDTFQAKPKSAITIAAWIKLEEKNGQHSIFDTVGASHAQGQFHFEVNDGVVRWFHRNECQEVVFETMAHFVPKGRWTHVAGTYDYKTKQAKIFINGEIRNQSIGDGQLSRDWGVRAGIGNHEKNRALRGSIDEFRIYNYALKSDEIKALVSACKANGGDEAAAAAQSQSPDITTDASLQEQAASRTSDDKPKVVATSTGPASSDSSSKRDEKGDSKEVNAVLRKRREAVKRSCVRKIQQRRSAILHF
ncbi:uncharacterized protein LOC100206840 isoform X1 [Hydra vulgaris]|uniref:uncharacterized protein LOC100206840 isoform X1 n=1 Tax=Hydra vulgaris TaxID=6087 RepID=UPI0032E9EE5B